MSKAMLPLDAQLEQKDNSSCPNVGFVRTLIAGVLSVHMDEGIPLSQAVALHTNLF